VNDFYYESFKRRWTTPADFEPARVVLETIFGFFRRQPITISWSGTITSAVSYGVEKGTLSLSDMLPHYSAVDGRLRVDNARIAIKELLPFIECGECYPSFHKSFLEWLYTQRAGDHFHLNDKRGSLRPIAFRVLAQSSSFRRRPLTLDRVPLFYGVLCSIFEQPNFPIEYPDSTIASSATFRSGQQHLPLLCLVGALEPKQRSELIHALRSERSKVGPGWWNDRILKEIVPQLDWLNHVNVESWRRHDATH
jgi:hypothetical protein